MRNNQPVTQQEYLLDDDHFLISRTDLKGRITYANPAFIEVSGFSHDELIGAPHNIVRHPDMPEMAFQNLWDTLKQGQSWKGLVKNRRRDGDHYWVEANVSPIIEGGEVKGFASVRVKPSRKDVEHAEAAYTRIREGNSRGLKLDKGQLKRRGLSGWLAGASLTSLRARIVTMVLVAGLLLVASSVLGLYGLQVSGDRLRTLDRDGLQDVARLQQIDQLTTQAHQMLSRSDRFELVEKKLEHADQLTDIDERLERLWSEFRARDTNQDGTADTFDNELTAYRQDGLGYAISLLHSEDNFDIFSNLPEHIETMQAQGEALADSINALIADKQDNAGVLAQQAREGQRQMLMALATLLGVGVLLLVLIAGMTLRAVMRPIRESRAFTLQIASGNLMADPPAHRRDELGQLVDALDIMRKSLGSIVNDVNGGIAIVTPAAHDIARGNEDLSARTEQQAASLQQTASSMEEMTTTVQHNSDNARQASGLAEENANESGASGELMQRAVSTMDEITAGARRMTEIIDVIDSIAFQTNILALNASVEAARAGEQGRGFAVVAQEVRNLASRSADAASEIRQLIDGSAQQIDKGATLIHEAEAAITKVMEASARVNDILGEITAASEEQSHGITQINSAVAEMDQVTQQNAARVQSSARAAGDLEHQSVMLANAIAAFRLNGSGMEQAPTRNRQQAAVTPAPATRATTSQSDGATGLAPSSDRVEEWEEF
ncbi:methyl-accepting chemotaxis protein [Halomonas sp. PAR8]|uniref:methyl-accepting chemotaxis protein n=1 Tax=Halomonas sp. PAR8 TaxID=3075515 RepID=UPI0028858A15|nr:methyl-accepting chemotaxis protein [Halomonas sp. PAR8]MDT0590147.1 methyl-accepting chemotaxis protein [Halomonas sp. PAR8]